MVPDVGIAKCACFIGDLLGLKDMDDFEQAGVISA
jgi:hypothetical protein